MAVKTKVQPEEKTKKGKKGKRGRCFLKALLVIVVLIALAAAASFVASKITNGGNRKKLEQIETVQYVDRIEPTVDAFGNVSFVTDRDLKVMQLTDVHIGGGWMSGKKDAMAINAVAAMVTAEKPDLVIVTGDVAYPVPFQAGTLNNKTSAKLFADLMERLGVYWTLVFGNHDTELYSFYSRETMGKFYSGGDYPHCLFKTGPEDVDGVGN
ncbi:MAG: metallophosphoesterase [Clostridia bacterium]|nr:metallophosphoesterase [Clostridia bacterium]